MAKVEKKAPAKVAAKAPVKEGKKLPVTTEAWFAKLKDGKKEAPVVELGGVKFSVESAEGLKAVLVRKDYR